MISFTASDARRVAWTFAQSFLAALVAGLAGWAAFPQSWDAAKAAGAALVVSALATAFSALKNALLTEGSAIK